MKTLKKLNCERVLVQHKDDLANGDMFSEMAKAELIVRIFKNRCKNHNAKQYVHTAITCHDDLLAACKAQHDAIDILCAMLIQRDKKFFPSKSGKPWKALVMGNAIIEKCK